LLRGQAPGVFAPQAPTSYADAVMLAIRLKGLEIEAQIEGEQLALATVHPITVTAEANWLEGYLTVARRNGILTEAEYTDITALPAETVALINETSNQMIEQAIERGIVAPHQVNAVRRDLSAALSLNRAWNAPVSRQQALVWITRALELNPVYGAAQRNIYTLRDWPSINPEYRPTIEAALQARIISGTNQGLLNPRATITRGEIASVADRAFPLAAGRLGYRLHTAWIDKIEYLYAAAAMNSNFNFDVGMQLLNLDGTYSKIFVTSQDSSFGNTSGYFPIYRYGQLINPRSLVEGWEVHYITSGSTVVWMEIR
jgi:hypothetical protein